MTSGNENGSQRFQDIQDAVSERYSGIAERVLAEAATVDRQDTGELTLDFIQNVAPGQSCCVSDQRDPSSANCGSSASELSDVGGERTSKGSMLYSEEQAAELPDSALDASLGCGNPVALAELNSGETILDLGSGGGIDCFLAARQGGLDGEGWGLDMTPSMIRLARWNAEKIEAKNVRFRLGEIEDIPFQSDHFDTVISNCVINLSTDKARVFREVFRVMKPGGKLRVSDMVWTRNISQEERGDAEAWASCIAGALPLTEYLEIITRAGFVDATADYEDNDRGVTSAYVSAMKPR